MTYKIGDKVEMVSMKNDPNPIKTGTKGVVTNVQVLNFWEETQIMILWENGRKIAALLPHDEIKKI